MSDAFDTIDHVILFAILKKYIGFVGNALKLIMSYFSDHVILFAILKNYIGFDGNALKLIMSYFSDRTQRVQIDGILSEFASIVCGVPQGSVLGPLKFCLYMLPNLPLSAILRFHKIGYHVYTDDTQIYFSFKYDDPL